MYAGRSARGRSAGSYDTAHAGGSGGSLADFRRAPPRPTGRPKVPPRRRSPVSHVNLVGALRPKAAAHYLSIGMETLRNSPVPRTYLPGRGVLRRILVYRLVDLDAYLARFQVGRPELVTSSEDAR